MNKPFFLIAILTLGLGLEPAILVAQETMYIGITTSDAPDQQAEMKITRSKDSASVLALSIEIKSLAPKVESKNFSFYPRLRCIEWARPGTSPDDPGECRRYETTGYGINSASVEAYSANLIIKNLATNETIVRELNPIKLEMFTRGGTTITAERLPDSLELQGRLNAMIMMGCLVKDPIEVGKVLDETVYVTICAYTNWAQGDWFPITKAGETFHYQLPTEVSYLFNAEAYWMVRDVPYTRKVKRELKLSDLSKKGQTMNVRLQ